MSGALRLADLTTLRLGGPVDRLVRVATKAELIDAVRAADAGGEPLLVLGGGSNVLAADDGFRGTVVLIATRGSSVQRVDGTAGVVVRVAAGEPWDELVARTVHEGWSGVEALSGIPGLVGATPLQNVGAYGEEVSQTLVGVRAWDRSESRVRTFSNAECGFGYRSSRFRGSDRWVVLDVSFQLARGRLSAPIRYAELARTLGTPPGERALLGDVRRAVLDLRRGKGMVLDPADHDTWSAGSFFTNPLVEAAALPAGAPAWPQPDGRVKTSAAWLIEQAGLARGHRGPGGRVALSGKHVLALTNRGAATAEDLLALAREVRDRVRARFGITLVTEPVLLGVEL